jgi:hypothetical protein
MKMKLGEVEGTLNGVLSLQTRLPSKTAYWIGSVWAREAQKEIDTLQKHRIKMAEEMAEKDADGKPVTVTKEVNGQMVQSYKLGDKQAAFDREYQDLLKTEIEIAFRPLPYEQFIGKNPSDFSVAEMFILGPFIIPIVDDTATA